MRGMMQDDGMKCPRCRSKGICKNGHKNGKQRYLCKDCRRQFVGDRSQPKYDEAFKQICLKAYRNGKSFREIERTYGVHHTTVLSWVEQAGFDLSEMARAPAAGSSLRAAQSLVQTAQSDLEEFDFRDSILSKALQLFAMHGYASVGMEKIAATAGVSTQVLGSYFENKESLFVALVQQLLDGIPQDLSALVDGDNLSAAPEVVLRQVAIALLTAFSKDQTIYILFRLVISESAKFPHLAKRFIEAVERPLFNQLSAYFKFHPDVQIVDPLVATRLFMGSLMHYWLIQNVLQEQAALPQERDRIVESLIAGIIAAA